MVTIYEDKESDPKEPERLPPQAVRREEPVQKPPNFLKRVEHNKPKISIPPDGLSPFINTFLEGFEESLRSKHDAVGPTIKVSELLGKLARLYEKVRNVVEYKGEHVLRRNAIERILKRLVWEQETIVGPKILSQSPSVDPRHVCETLLKELIRARYLPNSSIPESKVSEVERVVKKYLFLLKQSDNLPPGLSVSRAKDWIWGIASAEIEDLVDPSNRELYVKLMFDWFISYFDWQDKELSDDEKLVQVYLAIHRAYPKSDEPIMRYHLLLKKFPGWQESSEKQTEAFIQSFPDVYHQIEEELNFKGKYALYRKIQRHAAAFEIFRTIAEEEKLNLRNLLSKEEKLEEKIKKVCEERYKQIRTRVNTGIVRSIVYIFITKVVFALIIEVPYEIFRLGDIRNIPLTLNIMIPPMAMWLIGFSIRPPGEKNTRLITARIKSVVKIRESSQKSIFSIVQGRAKSTLGKIFTVGYAILFIIVFGTISYLLLKINFTVLGVLIFFGFMSLVLLFAFRVKFSAEQLKIEPEDEGIFEHLLSYLSIPFLNFGFYLSRGLAKLNFFTILLDFLIEAPLKSIIEIFEEWTSFLRQKREEVVEMPE